jgi:myosin heavy subunit
MTDYAAACKKIITMLKIDKDKYQLGKTKAFLKEAKLEDLRLIALTKYAIKLQKIWRMYFIRSYYLHVRKCITKIQACLCILLYVISPNCI